MEITREMSDVFCNCKYDDSLIVRVPYMQTSCRYKRNIVLFKQKLPAINESTNIVLIINII